MEQVTYWIVDIGIKVLGLVGIGCAAFQLINAKKTLVFSSLTQALALLEDREVRQARHWIDSGIVSDEYLKRLGELLRPANAENDKAWIDRETVERLVRSYDKLGYLTREGRFPLDLVARFYIRPLVKGWEKLQYFVESSRREQKGHYWEFEHLVIGVIIPQLRRNKGCWKGLKDHEGITEKQMAMSYLPNYDHDYKPRKAYRYSRFRDDIDSWMSEQEELLDEHIYR